MTFLDLATYFEKEYLKPAEYVDGRKVAGVRSIVPAKANVKAKGPKRPDFDLKSLNSPESMTTNRVAAAILTPEIRKPIRRIKR
jgi:hypothetical protein